MKLPAPQAQGDRDPGATSATDDTRPIARLMVVSSVVFCPVLLLNLGVVAKTIAIAWRRESEAPPVGAAVTARAG